MLEKMKIYFRKFYGRYSDLLQHYNTPLSQFLSDLVLCLCVSYIGIDLTGYDWLYSWSHGGCVSKADEVYLSCATIHTLGFSEVPVVSWVCNIYSRLCHDYGLNDIWLTDYELLFPSLYMYLTIVLPDCICMSSPVIRTLTW